MDIKRVVKLSAFTGLFFAVTFLTGLAAIIVDSVLMKIWLIILAILSGFQGTLLYIRLLKELNKEDGK